VQLDAHKQPFINRNWPTGMDRGFPIRAQLRYDRFQHLCRALHSSIKLPVDRGVLTGRSWPTVIDSYLNFIRYGVNTLLGNCLLGFHEAKKK